MKFKILAMLLGMSLFAFSAYATTYTINDNWVNWPGYDLPGYSYTLDEIGNPQIEKMLVTVNDTGLLESIEVYQTNRLRYDSLFINSYNVDTGSNWDSWDYFIRDGAESWDVYNGLADNGAYTVNAGFDYTYALSGRTGNPNGIVDSDLNLMTSPYSVDYDGYVLTYDLSGLDINVLDGFFVAYAPYCANDVIGGSPVPEPATLALLGFGLVGLAAYRRKIK